MNLAARLAKPMNLARTGVYFLESLPLAFFSRWFAHRDLPPPTKDQLSVLWKHILLLHERDAQALERGDFPFAALPIENPWRHARSYLGVLRDGVKVVWRMRNHRPQDLSKITPSAQDLPEYYTRDFHFQTDGYLSEASARRYDHQVEILFSGTASAMRRLILPVLNRHTIHKGRWLEIGCGTGSATQAVLKTFPKVHVTALDLSQPYLKVAQDRLREYPAVDFVQGDGANLQFKDESFEAVYCVYVLHEVPRTVREQIVKEAFRVLKPGGILIFADSLQKDDEPELNWALERFPKIYHEPFYKDYSGDELKALLGRVSGVDSETDHSFFTKIAWLKKPLLS